MTFTVSGTPKEIDPYWICYPHLLCQMNDDVKLFVEFATEHVECGVFSWVTRNVQWSGQS